MTPIAPFWHRLGAIVRYPLGTDALTTIAVLALLRLLVYLPNPFGFLLDLLVTVWMLRYCAEVLVHTARGHHQPPPGYGSWESGWVLLLVQILLLMIALFASVVAIAASAWLGVLLVVAVGIGAPAALMSAAIDGSMLRALNPLLWLQVIARIGPSYFAAGFLYLVIMTTSANIEFFLLPVLPQPIALVALSLVSHYALVMIFHLMGYLIHQHHDALGFEQQAGSDAGAEFAGLRRVDPDQAILDEAAQLVAGGDNPAALERLAQHLRERGGTDAVHDRYRRLLRLANDRPALLAHARDYLNVLIAREQWPKALQLWSETRAADPTAWPTSPELLRELIATAQQRGRDDLVLSFAEGFEQGFPGNSEALRIGLIVAEVLTERRGETDQARALLAGLAARFPRSQWRPEVERRLAALAPPA